MYKYAIIVQKVRGGAIREDGEVQATRTQKTHAVRSGIFGRARSSFSPVDNDPGDGTSLVAAPLDHCTPREAAKLFGELGGMNPSSSRAFVGDDRQSLEGKGGQHPRGGNGAKPFHALSRSTG